MSVLTHQDIPVWLISLERATERRANMQQRLAEIGLRYQIFDAVDGRANAQDLEATVDRAAFERNTGGTLLPGKMGVYQSHLQVWNRLIASDAPIGLILEDDVVFHDDFCHAVDVALSAQDHWDLIRFNAIRAKWPVSQGRSGTYSVNAYIGPFTGNGAYLMKRDLAVRLRPNLLPQTRPMDHELNRFFLHNYRQCGLEPWPSHVDDEGESQITGKAFADVKKFKLAARFPYYRLKAANYLRRIWWLALKGMIWPKTHRLR